MTDELSDNMSIAYDFKRFLNSLVHWAWFLILVTALGAAVTFFYSRQQTPVYEATASILVTRSAVPTVADLSQTLSLSQLVDTYVRMMSADEFLDIVSQRMGYKVEADNVDVSALPNTQVIQLQVQDTDPTRAALTADTMVKLLEEQNESMQAGRYTDVEQSLDTQIKETEKQITDLQAKLDLAATAAFNEQIAEVEAKIDRTVEAITETTLVLDQIKKTDWKNISLQLSNDRTMLAEQQKLLDQKTVESESLKSTYSTDTKVQADPNYAVAVREQISEVESEIEQTTEQIQELQDEIEFLTPLETRQGYFSASVENENLLKTQQAQLTAYQNVYSTLLSTGEAKITPEIQRLKNDLAFYQNTALGLSSSREEIRKQRLQNTPPIEQIGPALASNRPVRPRTLLNTLLGGVAGIILAFIFITIREMTDDAIKDPIEIAKYLNANIIGYVSQIKSRQSGKGVYVAQAPYSPTTDAFRALRNNLEFSAIKTPIKTILVTSGEPGEGKTTVAVNLAAILTQHEKKVILVDANLRSPHVHLCSGVSNISGLGDLIAQGNIIDVDKYIQKSEYLPSLSILPGGNSTSDTIDQLGSEKMHHLLKALSSCYDFVVIDCATLLSADGQVLLSAVDGVVLIIVPGKTRRETVQAVNEQVKHSDARILGVVLNRLQDGRWNLYGGGLD